MELTAIFAFPTLEIAQKWNDANPIPDDAVFESSILGSYIRIFNIKIKNQEQYDLVLNYQRRVVEAGHQAVSFDLFICFK